MEENSVQIAAMIGSLIVIVGLICCIIKAGSNKK